jgi:WD40 repeat protein
VSNVISRAVFSPDSQFIAAGIGSNKVALWDASTLHEQAVFDDACAPVAFSRNGRALMTRGTNYFLRTYDVATQAVLNTIWPRPVEEIDANFALSPDGEILAFGLPNGTIMFCDAKTGAVIATIVHAYLRYVFQLAFSPDGKLLATTGISDGPAVNALAPKIWDTATHKLVAAPPGHTDLVLDAAFSPDGNTLATCGVDDSIRFWDTTTWKEIPPALGQKEYVNSVAFSPNGARLASSCADGTMRLWNVATRRELASLKLDWAFWYTSFSPDGQTLAVKCWDESLRLLRAPVPDTK